MAQLLSQLSVGSKVKFGKYQVESETPEPIVWTIVAKNHVSEPAYPDNSITLHASEILDLRCFDAKEPSNSDSDRVSYGNNRYAVSNMNNWLNSKAAAGAWYSAQHSADQSPNSSNYVSEGTEHASRPGFLNLFSDEEYATILNTKIRVVKPSIDGGSYEDIAAKVFLPSTTEVGLENENRIAEGAAWNYYTTNAGRVGYLTTQAYNNTKSTYKPSSVSAAWHWWLRTPYSSYSYRARVVFSSGRRDYYYAYHGHGGVRPALNLPSSLSVSDSTDSDGCYTFIWATSALEAPVFQSMSDSVSAGENISVAWSAVTGADSYDLQRSVDGAEFATISSGNASTIYTDTANSTWSTVQYRVRSVSGSRYSDWAKSVLITVQQSATTITAPESITVPELNSGASASVTWSEAPNASGYILERSVDGSGFTEVYRGSETVYADMVLSSWDTVQYRVCAYDGDGNTSEYTSSAVVRVNKLSVDLLSAIRNHAEQYIKLIFEDGTVVDKSDISSSGDGFILTEVLNGDNDMTVGRAVSSQVEATLFNDSGKFTAFDFSQEFELQFGFKVGESIETTTIGKFKGERPEKVRGRLINFTAYDRMVKFDISAEEFILGLTFPATLGEIFQSLCAFVGVNTDTSTFINSDKQFSVNPFTNSDYTAREVLSWIAEAACSYARMNADGKVELVWYVSKSHTILRSDRFEMSESEFAAPQIDKLEVYNSYGDQLVSAGTGKNTYVISDNPFLYIENDTEIEGLQPFVNQIYNRLSTFPEYYPASLRAEWYPEIRCGDIVSVVNDYGDTVTFPIFSQTLRWNGFGITELENTGGVTREIAPVQQRELEQLKKNMLRTTDLYTSISSYLNSQEGKASIKSAVGGEFVKISDGSSLTATNEIEQLVENTEDGINNKISLTAGVGKGTIGSNVQAMLTLFANADSSNIRLAANAITLTATPQATQEEYEVGEQYHLVNQTYYFEKTSDGYYTSNNAGVNNSYAYGLFRFSFTEQTTVKLYCISYGESNYDYGIVSTLDNALSNSNSADTDNVLKSFKGKSSASARTLTISVPEGTHIITFKYIKDSSGNSGGDYFKIKATATRTIQGRDTVLSLSSGGVQITSANLNLTGTVTFSDLSTAGATVINGANVTTDNLFLSNVFFKDNPMYTVVTSEMSGENGIVKVGVQSSSKNMAAMLELYGHYIDFVDPDSPSSHRLQIQTKSRNIIPSDKSWYLGSESNYFNRIYIQTIYFSDGTSMSTAP